MPYDVRTAGVPVIGEASTIATPTLLPEFGAPSTIEDLRDAMLELWNRMSTVAALYQQTEFRFPERQLWETLQALNIFNMTHGGTLPDTRKDGTPLQAGDMHADYSQAGIPLRPLIYDGEEWVSFLLDIEPGGAMIDALLDAVLVNSQVVNAPNSALVNALRTELRDGVAEDRNTLKKLSDAINAVTPNTNNLDLTGTPTAPTAAPGTNTVQVATTAFAKAAADAAAAASVPLAQKGAASGVATLDSTGKVPTGQLPSFVEDVIEVANYAALPGTGLANKLYVTVDNNKVFRWSGTVYIEIVATPGSTDAIAEGSTNKYFTDARAQAAVVTSMSRRGVMVGDYGSGDMTTSAGFTARLIAAIAEAGVGGEVIIPYGMRGLTEKVTPLASQLIRGIGGHPKMTKEFNGDMFDCSAAEVQFENIWLAGAGGSFTGRGFVMTNASFGKQKFRNVWGYGMAGPVVDFTVADAGNKSTFTDCTFQRQTSTNAAVVLPSDTAESTGARDFMACHADGGTLIAFNKSANTRMLGGDCTSLDFSGSAGISLRAAIDGVRIANGGSTMSILGNDVSMARCIHGGSIELGASSSRNFIDPGVLATGAVITDLSTATGEDVNRISNYGVTGDPIWLADTTNPSYGNALRNSRVSFLGRHILFTGEITMGSTTSYGSGNWFVRPPAPWSGLRALTKTSGSAKIWRDGTGYLEATCRMAAGSDKLYFSPAGGGNDVNASVPFGWTANSRIEWSILFERG
ncbi:MAG: hypothetical protein C0421_05645 [Hyphomonas sp.]|uniref:hypothetical protein n=1 Tax=Hyphomonas sp. TaxID=87 RepID=UPI0025C2B1A0|nr:hypothetical protein [Hyphomonas sp.]MBA4338310.1 hypothetical protein [Hyphomonas sp.]